MKTFIEIQVINWEDYAQHESQFRVIVTDENFHQIFNMAEVKTFELAKSWIAKQKFEEIVFKVVNDENVSSRKLRKALEAEKQRRITEDAKYWE
ncbi:hypothetical protein PS2_152 [Serratia phage PS2]|uniref:Uncharacterized protein n=1 Tax=Serratia phage PS2 TaxID=1481112 RepID=A0A023W5Q3_9CAUD|nr:hypothetical protein FF83_gp263 [Serratia phage PS2]AHY25398.1 hypothetical protein PS2_152 [Serratia phage PS2]